MKKILYLCIGIIVIIIMITIIYGNRENLGASKNTQLTAQEITVIMDKLNTRFATDAQYIQVRKDGTLVIGNTVITDTQLKALLPDNITVTTYGGTCGNGFQIIQTTPDHYYSWGYGCEASSRTFDTPLPIP